MLHNRQAPGRDFHEHFSLAPARSGPSWRRSTRRRRGRAARARHCSVWGVDELLSTHIYLKSQVGFDQKGNTLDTGECPRTKLVIRKIEILHDIYLSLPLRKIGKGTPSYWRISENRSVNSSHGL